VGSEVVGERRAPGGIIQFSMSLRVNRLSGPHHVRAIRRCLPHQSSMSRLRARPRAAPTDDWRIAKHGPLLESHPRFRRYEGTVMPRGMLSAMIRQIAPQFFTTDLRATLAYYRNTLGFECVGTWEDPPVYAIVARDEHRIHFRLAEWSSTYLPSSARVAPARSTTCPCPGRALGHAWHRRRYPRDNPVPSETRGWTGPDQQRTDF
jgi:hypothetical protein